MKAYKYGKKVCNRDQHKNFDFSEYVYKKLSGKARKVWKEINAVEKTKNGAQKVECILKSNGTRMRQYLFIHAWICSNFVVSKAMRKVNLSRKMFNNWCSDPDFLQMMNEVKL